HLFVQNICHHGSKRYCRSYQRIDLLYIRVVVPSSGRWARVLANRPDQPGAPHDCSRPRRDFDAHQIVSLTELHFREPSSGDMRQPLAGTLAAINKRLALKREHRRTYRLLYWATEYLTEEINHSDKGEEIDLDFI